MNTINLTNHQEHQQVFILMMYLISHKRKTSCSKVSNVDKVRQFKKTVSNATTCQTNNVEKLLAKIEKDPLGLLSIILDMRNIYTKYLVKANEANKEWNSIRTDVLEQKPELYIGNEVRKRTVFFLQQQTVQMKRCEIMIDVLQNLVRLKPDILYHLSKKSIISAFYHLYMSYYPQSINNYQVKINGQYTIHIPDMMTALLDLGNSLRIYRIFIFLLIKNTYQWISRSLTCKANLKFTRTTTLLTKGNLSIQKKNQEEKLCNTYNLVYI